MSKMIDRLETIAEDFRESLPRDRKRFEETPYTSVLSTLRFLAVADYMKTKNPEDFRAHLREIVEYVIKMYQRRKMIVLPDTPFLAVASYEYIFVSLASGDWSLTNKLLMYMKKYIYSNDLGGFHEFFMISVLGDPLNRERLEESILLTGKKSKSYVGYLLAFRAIADKNLPALEEAFKEIMKGHKWLCTPAGYFGGTEDEVIAIWPLAILNLARFNGLFFEVNNSYIPEELLVTPEEVKASLEAWEKEKKIFKVQPPTEDLLKEEEFYEMLVEKKIPKEFYRSLFSLYRNTRPVEARSHFVGIFNNDREFKKFKKYVPILPKYLIERIIELILAKSTYHQKQCDELKALMK
ncbi:MAG TPA: hypothetical protein PLY23_09175 [Alphaproteobacteria bacterium]|nr:hypothetical protein [Alphaproteobacteria bacterium]HQS94335.1 hypothetical protein [Alphaproteobacteria bacterium]